MNNVVVTTRPTVITETGTLAIDFITQVDNEQQGNDKGSKPGVPLRRAQRAGKPADLKGEKLAIRLSILQVPDASRIWRKGGARC